VKFGRAKIEAQCGKKRLGLGKFDWIWAKSKSWIFYGYLDPGHFARLRHAKTRCTYIMILVRWYLKAWRSQ